MVVGSQASNKSDVESIASSQQASLFSGVDSPSSTRVALTYPSSLRKMVVVVVILVQESDAKAYSISDVGLSLVHASMRGSFSSSALCAQQIDLSTPVGVPTSTFVTFIESSGLK